MNKPYELSAQEWVALAAVQEVIEAWALDEVPFPAACLMTEAYGVRFEYQCDGPGYVGPLYLLQGAGAPETAPIAIIETEDGFEVVEQHL